MKLESFEKKQGNLTKDLLDIYSDSCMIYFWSLRGYPITELEIELRKIQRADLRDDEGHSYPVISYAFHSDNLVTLLLGIKDFCETFHKRNQSTDVIFLRQKFNILEHDDKYHFFTRIGVLPSIEKAEQCLKFEKKEGTV